MRPLDVEQRIVFETAIVLELVEEVPTANHPLIRIGIVGESASGIERVRVPLPVHAKRCAIELSQLVDTDLRRGRHAAETTVCRFAVDLQRPVQPWTWVVSGSLTIPFGLLSDPLSAVMLLIVTGVGFLIHVYSVGYMEDDPGYWRFFAYLNFFVFAMALLVAADNFLFLLVGWASWPGVVPAHRLLVHAPLGGGRRAQSLRGQHHR